MQAEAEFEVTTALIIFFADFFYWFLTVFLINKVIDSKAIKAGIFAAALNCSSYVAVFYFVKNFNYLLPACLGALVGSTLAVEYDKRHQKTSRKPSKRKKKRKKKNGKS